VAREQLKLQNQLCFPVYAASRLMIREYQPYLDRLGITYAQYLVLMVLWETDSVPVSRITQRLFLNTNTVTPILKRMEAQGLITRQRAASDERKVIVSLTPQGRQLETAAAAIPEQLVASLVSAEIDAEELLALKEQLERIVQHLAATTAATDSGEG
jgi:MarR family transcriptional regulator, organic hydroperoxide resistance regulator